MIDCRLWHLSWRLVLLPLVLLLPQLSNGELGEKKIGKNVFHDADDFFDVLHRAWTLGGDETNTVTVSREAPAAGMAQEQALATEAALLIDVNVMVGSSSAGDSAVQVDSTSTDSLTTTAATAPAVSDESQTEQAAITEASRTRAQAITSPETTVGATNASIVGPTRVDATTPTTTTMTTTMTTTTTTMTTTTTTITTMTTTTTTTTTTTMTTNTTAEEALTVPAEETFMSDKRNGGNVEDLALDKPGESELNQNIAVVVEWSFSPSNNNSVEEATPEANLSHDHLPEEGVRLLPDNETTSSHKQDEDTGENEDIPNLLQSLEEKLPRKSGRNVSHPQIDKELDDEEGMSSSQNSSTVSAPTTTTPVNINDGSAGSDQNTAITKSSRNNLSGGSDNTGENSTSGDTEEDELSRFLFPGTPTEELGEAIADLVQEQVLVESNGIPKVCAKHVEKVPSMLRQMTPCSSTPFTDQHASSSLHR